MTSINDADPRAPEWRKDQGDKLSDKERARELGAEMHLFQTGNERARAILAALTAVRAEEREAMRAKCEKVCREIEMPFNVGYSRCGDAIAALRDNVETGTSGREGKR
jgi:hypothetical protein